MGYRPLPMYFRDSKVRGWIQSFTTVAGAEGFLNLARLALVLRGYQE